MLKLDKKWVEAFYTSLNKCLSSLSTKKSKGYLPRRKWINCGWYIAI